MSRLSQLRAAREIDVGATSRISRSTVSCRSGMLVVKRRAIPATEREHEVADPGHRQIGEVLFVVLGNSRPLYALVDAGE